MAIPDETINDQPLLSKNKIIILSVLLALLLLGSGYALYSYSSNSTLRQYQTLTAEMSMEKMREMPAEERKEYFENMKNLREKMTEPQKEKADDSMRERFQTQMSEKMNKFFALPPEERKVELDKEVDRMASMMKNFGGGKGGAPGGAGAGKAPGGANAQGRGQGGAPNAGGANGNGQGGAERVVLMLEMVMWQVVLMLKAVAPVVQMVRAKVAPVVQMVRAKVVLVVPQVVVAHLGAGAIPMQRLKKKINAPLIV